MDKEEETTTSSEPEAEPTMDASEDKESIRRVGSAQASFDPTTSSSLSSGSLYAGKKNGASKPLLLVFGLIVLLVIGATGFLLRDKFTKEEVVLTPAPESSLETPVNEPSPTPEAFDRGKYTLRVLNGTKTSGLAASEAAKLKELGYQIGKTGNATSSAIAQTTIRLKGEPEGFLEALIKDLSADFEAVAGKALDSDDDVDAEVILGAK